MRLFRKSQYATHSRAVSSEVTRLTCLQKSGLPNTENVMPTALTVCLGADIARNFGLGFQTRAVEESSQSSCINPHGVPDRRAWGSFRYAFHQSQGLRESESSRLSRTDSRGGYII